MSEYDQEADYKAFLRQLPELLKDNAGKYALIHDGNLVKVYKAESTALEFGILKYGTERFIVQRITDEEPQFISYSMLV